MIGVSFFFLLIFFIIIFFGEVVFCRRFLFVDTC